MRRTRWEEENARRMRDSTPPDTSPLFIVTSDGFYPAHNGIYGPFPSLDAACQWVSKQEMDGYHDLCVRQLTMTTLDSPVLALRVGDDNPDPSLAYQMIIITPYKGDHDA